MEFGLVTFADLPAGMTAKQRMDNLLEEARLADEVGIDIFAIGEHHREDYLISSPTTALAAIARETERIRLASAVSVLSSDDPIRVYQQFSEIDLLSDGRAEIIAGRGSFTESFPLFGYNLGDYDLLFEEKIDILAQLCRSGRVTFRGQHRSQLIDTVVYPEPLQQPLPLWRAVGGSPQSVERAAMLELPLMIAIIGGSPRQFVPFVELYRSLSSLPVGITSHGFISSSLDAANSAFAAPYLSMMNRIGRERGWRPATNQQYQAMTSPEGHLLIGSPEQVAEKIIAEYRLFKNDRTMLHLSLGSVAHDKVLEAIELYGREVIPRVRQMLSDSYRANS